MFIVDSIGLQLYSIDKQFYFSGCAVLIQLLFLFLVFEREWCSIFNY